MQPRDDFVLGQTQLLAYVAKGLFCQWEVAVQAVDQHRVERVDAGRGAVGGHCGHGKVGHKVGYALRALWTALRACMVRRAALATPDSTARTFVSV